MAKIQELTQLCHFHKFGDNGESEKLAQNEDIKEFYLGMTQLGERKSYRDVKHYRRRKRWLG